IRSQSPHSAQGKFQIPMKRQTKKHRRMPAIWISGPSFVWPPLRIQFSERARLHWVLLAPALFSQFRFFRHRKGSVPGCENCASTPAEANEIVELVPEK